MTLMSSFGTGVAAMVAQSTAMDAISQNIANLRTAGYKRADTNFVSLLQGIEANPYKPGGVAAQIRKLVDVDGAIESSGRPLDIAIAGKGMFVYSNQTTGAGELFFSRKGSLDPSGVQTASGGAGYLSAFDDLYLMAWKVDLTGKVLGTSASDMVAIPNTPSSGFAGQATTTATLSMVLPAVGSTSATVDLATYDSSGVEQTVALTWTKTGVNAWNVEAFDKSGTSIGGPSAVTFDGDGTLVSPTSFTANGIGFDLSNVTQRGAILSKGSYVQDGLAAGNFLNYEVGMDGMIAARFSSGAVKPAYQLPLALFSNFNGLAEYPGGLWGVSDTSGNPEFFASGSTSKILAGSVEASNVDLADSFSQMIVTQRAYSSAAQLIQTADEMTQTVRDLR